MKGYKAFDKELRCRDMQYEVGQTYELDGEIKPCEKGFHFCETIADCYEHYPKTEDTRICEVEALGEIKQEGNKYCTNKIRIVRELTKEEHNNVNVGLNNCGYCNKGNDNKGNDNKGNANKGNCNEGNANKGNWNKGNCNEGNYNKGDRNIGIRNKGDYNKGNWNEGDCNEGNVNEGNYNKGNWNIGIMNKGNYLIGIANTKPTPFYLFNKPCPISYEELTKLDGWYDLLNGELTDNVRELPNFDEEIWNEIMGD